MADTVKCLPCKCETPSSVSRIHIKKQKSRHGGMCLASHDGRQKEDRLWGSLPALPVWKPQGTERH